MSVDPIFFGAGTLTLVPPGENPTPVQVGVLQDVDVDISFSTKELHGAVQFPVAVARTKGKITGKAKSGSINGGLANSILSGGTVTSGRPVGAEEQFTIASETATVANSGDFLEDLGAVDLTAGLALVRVASGPTAGQYSVSSGVYTFDASADDHVVSIRYSYTDDTGSTIAFVNNVLMGAETVFQVHLYNTTHGESSGIKLWSCIFSKLTFPFKNEDFAMNDMAFEGFADPQRRVIDVYTPNTLPTT